MLSSLGAGRELITTDTTAGGTTSAPFRRRLVGGYTIHEGMAEDQVTDGAPIPGPRVLRRSRGPVDSVDCQIHVSRPAYTVSELRSNLCYAAPEEPSLLQSTTNSLRSCVSCSPASLLALLMLRLPVLSWLPRYKMKKDFVSDIIAGITVAVMHLPQGMAYAMLADVPPILGLYTAFFPVLAYAFFGTSKHVSMGTFAVACLMTGKVVGELSSPSSSPMTSSTITSITLLEPTNATAFASYGNSLNPTTTDEEQFMELEDKLSNSASLAYVFNNDSAENLDDILGGAETSTDVPAEEGDEELNFDNKQVAVAVSFMVGVWQIVFGVLQLGQMCVFLSDMLISGFTTGAACHVLSSQIKHILGIQVKRYSGPFRLIYTYIDIFTALPTANITAVIMSAVCITVLAINNEIFKPRVKKFTNFPIPIELIVVILGTVVSYFTQFEHTNDLAVVGDIPTGLPDAMAPDHRLFVPVLVDSFVIAIVIYAVTFSMAKIFSKKHGYKVDATQELYAGGIGNLFGSMFSSLPSCASLSRSLIQESVGGKSQVTSFVSCSVILVVLLFVGPVFESLPNCVLASIILVALKGMFMQVYDFLKMWKQSRGDALLWLAAFLTTVLVDIDYGLGTGVLLSLFLLLKRNNEPTVTKLGWIPKTDIYVDIDTYQSAVSVPGSCLCHVSGALHFANIDRFREQLMLATELDTAQIIAAKAKREKGEESESRSAALQTLPPGDGVSSPPHQEPSTAEEGVDNTSSPRRRKEQVIVVENSGHNLTKEVIREAVVNIFRRSSSSSYACEEGQQDGAKTNAVHGHENKAYLADDCSTSYPPSTAQSPDKQNRLSKSFSKGILLPTQDVSFVVLGLSGVGWIDVSAAKQLGLLFTEHNNAGITLALAGANDSVVAVLRQCGVLATIPEHRLYHSLHDAVSSLLPDALHSKPQQIHFVGDGVKGTGGPQPTTHDARPAVVPATMHNIRNTSATSGVKEPKSAGTSTLEVVGEVAGPNVDENHKSQRSTTGQSNGQKEGKENENCEIKRVQDGESNSHSPRTDKNNP